MTKKTLTTLSAAPQRHYKKIFTAVGLFIVQMLSQTAQAVHPELDQSYYNPTKDLLELHYDMLHDADDMQALVAAKMMLKYYGIDAIVVAGTKSQAQRVWNPNNEAKNTLNVTYPQGACSSLTDLGNCGLVSVKGWVNAGDHWNNKEDAPVVQAVANIWKRTLDQGGKVYIAEGGMGDFTVHVAKWLINHGYNRTTVKNNVISVQHSNWNMEQSGSGLSSGSNVIYGSSKDFKFEPKESYTKGGHLVGGGNGQLQTLITHWRINDGNGPYGNGGTEKTSQAAIFWNAAYSGPYRNEWEIAQFTGSKSGRVDFSDTVELAYILGVDADIKNYNPQQERWINFIEKYNQAPKSTKPTSKPTKPTSTILTQTGWKTLWGTATSPIGTPSSQNSSGTINITASALRYCFQNTVGPIEVFEVEALNRTSKLQLSITESTGWVSASKVLDNLYAGKTTSTNRASHSGKGFQCINMAVSGGPKQITQLKINHDAVGTWRITHAYVQYK